MTYMFIWIIGTMFSIGIEIQLADKHDRSILRCIFAWPVIVGKAVGSAVERIGDKN